MTSYVSSKHLRGNSELLVQAPIKKGLVPTSDTLTYTTRLATLLEALFALRQLGVEAFAGSVAGPLDQVRSLHFVQWAVINNGADLLLAVTFDGAWETYIRDVYASAGEFLDVILCHCEDFKVVEGPERGITFAKWVRKHQVRCNYFHSATPAVSSNDVRYLRDFENLQATTNAAALPVKAVELHELPTDPAPLWPKRAELFIAVVNGLYRLLDAFPLRPTVGVGDFDCDRAVFERAASTELFHLYPGLDESIKALLVTDAGQWAEQRLGQAKAAEAGAKATNDQPAVPIDLSVLDAAPGKRAFRDDVQGNIVTGYEGMTRGCVAFLQFDTPRDLATFAAHFEPTTEGDASATGGVRQNVAFTYGGLARLALDDATIDLLPAEFREGMEARAGFLGDIGPNHPRNWTYPIANWRPDAKEPLANAAPLSFNAVDAVVILQHPSDEALWTKSAPLNTALQKLGELRARVLGVQPLRRDSGKAAAAAVGGGSQGTGGAPGNGKYFREHFGFLDGLSQPIPDVNVAGKPVPGATPGPKRDVIPLGELLLGFPNVRGENPFEGNAILANGSFLAMRKLAQHLGEFKALTESLLSEAKVATRTKATKDYYLGKIMGRTPEGATLPAGSTPASLGSSGNNFDYKSDSEGQGCPFHAHARRANPRAPIDAMSGPVPRIMRRGFSYDERTDAQRIADEAPDDSCGLLFMAFNASLAGQFEAIQGWLSGGNSTGVLSRQRDLVTGVHGIEDQGRLYSFLDDGKVIRIPAPTRPLVRLRWGLYLFAPAVTGLREIAKAAAVKSAPGPVPLPRNPPPKKADAEPLPVQVARQLLGSLEGVPSALLQTMFEDRGWTDINEAFWILLRGRQNEQTEFECQLGKLVPNAAEVLKVLGNAETHSVRPYDARMRSSFGPLYLGFDTNTRAYEEASRAPNAFINKITAEQAFLLAHQKMSDALNVAATLPATLPPLGTSTQPRRAVDLTTFTGPIMYELSSSWFGTPDAQRHAFPDDFHLAAEYIFHPHPGETLALDAARRGQVLQGQFRAFVDGAFQVPLKDQSEPSRLLEYLRWTDLKAGATYWNEERTTQAVLGAINGFVVPTSGSFQSVLNQWVEGGDFWHLQQAYLASRRLFQWPSAGGAPPFGDPLMTAIVDAMRRRPVPDLLHRAEVPDGKPVVVSLASAAVTDRRPEVLFGGEPSAQPHACPGMNLALGVILGLVVALFERTDVRRETVMVVSYAE